MATDLFSKALYCCKRCVGRSWILWEDTNPDPGFKRTFISGNHLATLFRSGGPVSNRCSRARVLIGRSGHLLPTNLGSIFDLFKIQGYGKWYPFHIGVLYYLDRVVPHMAQL